MKTIKWKMVELLCTRIEFMFITLVNCGIILNEMHNFPYDGHPGYQKKGEIVRNYYFWLGVKKYIVEYIARCMECQRVKFEHKNLVGFLLPYPIPKRK